MISRQYWPDRMSELTCSPGWQMSWEGGRGSAGVASALPPAMGACDWHSCNDMVHACGGASLACESGNCHSQACCSPSHPPPHAPRSLRYIISMLSSQHAPLCYLHACLPNADQPSFYSHLGAPHSHRVPAQVLKNEDKQVGDQQAICHASQGRPKVQRPTWLPACRRMCGHWEGWLKPRMGAGSSTACICS